MKVPLRVGRMGTTGTEGREGLDGFVREVVVSHLINTSWTVEVRLLVDRPLMFRKQTIARCYIGQVSTFLDTSAAASMVILPRPIKSISLFTVAHSARSSRRWRFLVRAGLPFARSFQPLAGSESNIGNRFHCVASLSRLSLPLCAGCP